MRRRNLALLLLLLAAHPAPAQEPASPPPAAAPTTAAPTDVPPAAPAPPAATSAAPPVAPAPSALQALLPWAALALGALGTLLGLVALRRRAASAADPLALDARLAGMVKRLDDHDARIRRLHDATARHEPPRAPRPIDRTLPPRPLPPASPVATAPLPFTPASLPPADCGTFSPAASAAALRHWAAIAPAYHALADEPSIERRDAFMRDHGAEPADLPGVAVDLLWWTPLRDTSGLGLLLPAHKPLRDWPKAYRGETGRAARAQLEPFYPKQGAGNALRILEPAVGRIDTAMSLLTPGSLEGV